MKCMIWQSYNLKTKSIFCLTQEVAEIYSKFAKQFIQIAGPKNIQHNIFCLFL